MPGYQPYRVSQDGKTVTVGGKTYSVASFRKQFEISTGGTDKPGGRGAVVAKKDAPKIVKVTSDGPEKPYTKAQEKANTKAVEQLNKAKVGEKLLAREKGPMPPKPRSEGGIATPGAVKRVNPVYRMFGGGGGGAFGIKNR